MSSQNNDMESNGTNGGGGFGMQNPHTNPQTPKMFFENF